MSVYTGYPFYSFVQDFEVQYDRESLRQWFVQYWSYSLYFSAFYLVLIASLKEYMKDRKPMKIRKAVLIWDILLALFSICGMVRCVPEIVYMLTNIGMESTVCDSTANSVTMFWFWAFAFSKAPELLDTVFIVLKKQKLTFLHLVHHVLTLVVTWFYFSYLPAGGRWMVSLNYTVHALMYTYFAMKAAKLNIPIKVSMIMTTAQIVQMIVGILVATYALRANFLGRRCTTNIHMALVGLAFGLFLLYLFVDFFLHRYKFLKPKTMEKTQ